ncbi:hypothetical protein SAMN05216330_12030 [Bradyrhizobium sp. Ghvi]|nr:hypothetical protein SAMN05216330_12030 [Bradyrhizobium sp. Ghvi]
MSDLEIVEAINCAGCMGKLERNLQGIANRTSVLGNLHQ